MQRGELLDVLRGEELPGKMKGGRPKDVCGCGERGQAGCLRDRGNCGGQEEMKSENKSNKNKTFITFESYR